MDDDDFFELTADLKRDGVPGCTTSVHRHNVRAELPGELRRLWRAAVPSVLAVSGVSVVLAAVVVW